MITGRTFVRTSAAISLVLGLAACGGQQQAPQAAQQQPATVGAGQTTGGYWEDPKAPRAGGQRAAGAQGMDDDWDDDDFDDNGIDG